ncbi:MAG TPA: hypothetical protein PLS45_07230, partial [Bacillota bacterium]|nr:hypothetical protein [Bacillota bacterium]
ESGMVAAGVLKNSFVAEAYVPEAVGQKRELLIGKKSGAQVIAKKLEERGITAAREEVKELLLEVKEFAISHKRALEEEEFFSLANKVISKK